MNTSVLSPLEQRVAVGEPSYRSRGEAQLGRVLDRYRIPFVHEQATPIQDRRRQRTWHPDFTLPGYGGLILEYAGMMDIPDYAAGIRHKRRAYARNGRRVLFVYPRDLRGPGWPERLIHRIEYARSCPGYPRYGARRYGQSAGTASRIRRRVPMYRRPMRAAYRRRG